MLRHNHVTDHTETVPRAHLIENLHEPVARSSRSKKRSPTITTERNEVKIPSPVVALERIAHAFEKFHKPRKTRTLKPAGCGTPLTILGELQKWYALSVLSRQEKKPNPLCATRHGFPYNTAHKDEYEDVFQDVYDAVVRFMKLCGIKP